MDDQSNGNLLGAVTSWWRHPFNSQGSAFAWVMFVGVLVIAAFLWNLVIIEITREV